MKVNGILRDLRTLKKTVTIRKKRIMDASPKPLRHDPIKGLARILHPEKNKLRIKSIVDVSQDVKLIRFVKASQKEAKLPVFQSGQYLSLRIDMEETSVTRPYFICSPPFKALPIINEDVMCEPYIEIILVKKESSTSNKYLWGNLKVGDEIEASLPHGKFFYEPLRDSSNLVALSEDAGIGIFYSMMCEIIEKNLELNIILFYKNKLLKDNNLFYNLKKLIEEAPTKLSVTILEENQNFSDEIVKLGEEIINKSTYFICGSQNMYEDLCSTLSKLNIPRRRIRKQIYGEYKNIYDDINFPEEAKEKIFKITVVINGEEKVIDSCPGETVLATLEKAEIKKASHCRSGECGFCRSRIVEGDVFVNSLLDTRRMVDKEFGYFHPCVSFPITDIKIDIIN